MTIQNSHGNKTTPSVVSFKGAEPRIGEAALALSTSFPGKVLYDAKRIIGQRVQEAKYQTHFEKMQPYWPFGVQADKRGRPMFDLEESKNKTRPVRPEYVSSYVLRKLKQAADGAQDNNSKKKCVVTIPAHFSERQRQSTIDSIKIADLDLIEILEEPVAAALAQGLGKFTGQGVKYLLVYDFGGGTLDLTILKIENGKF